MGKCVRVCACVRVCVCACVRASERACVCASLRACVRMGVLVGVLAGALVGESWQEYSLCQSTISVLALFDGRKMVR